MFENFVQPEIKFPGHFAGTYSTFQHFKKRVEARAIINRKERERIDYASQNLAHGDKGMSMEVLKDIKCLRKKDCNWRHDKYKL